MAFDIKAQMQLHGLGSAEVARLLGVSVRAVAMWRSADRAVPGPVRAYFDLLGALPKRYVALELHKLRKRT